jgi:hypothetical protein
MIVEYVSHVRRWTPSAPSDRRVETPTLCEGPMMIVAINQRCVEITSVVGDRAPPGRSGKLSASMSTSRCPAALCLDYVLPSVNDRSI